MCETFDVKTVENEYGNNDIIKNKLIDLLSKRSKQFE